MSETVRTHLRVRASELVGRDWLNTGGKSLDLEYLRGKIVLLDFWTFCCINCLHVLDELRPLEQQYADVLVTVGVHSPKFEHEADPWRWPPRSNATRSHHPVLDDPELDTWKAVRRPGLADPGGHRPRGLHRRAAVRRGPRGRPGRADPRADRRARGQGHPAPRRRPVRGAGADVGTRCGSRARLLAAARAATLVLVSDTGHHRLVELSTDFQTCWALGSGERATPTATPRPPGSTSRRAWCLLPEDVAEGGRLRRRRGRLRQPPAPRAVPRGRHGHGRSPATACSGCWTGPARVDEDGAASGPARADLACPRRGTSSGPPSSTPWWSRWPECTRSSASTRCPAP